MKNCTNVYILLVFLISLLNPCQTLGQNFGFILLKSTPEGAKVTINGSKTDKITPYQAQLPEGLYTFTLTDESQGYLPYKDHFEIKTNKTTIIEASLLPNFGEVFIEPNHSVASLVISVLPNNAEIFIDDKFQKTGFYSGQMPEGSYDIKVNLDKHYSIEQTIYIKEGEEKRLDYKLDSIFGSLSVMVDPPETKIYLNDKYYGLSPLVISNLMIGEYTLRLEKSDYADYSEKIVIGENITTSIDHILPRGHNILLQSTPSGAQIYFDNNLKGETPKEFINLNSTNEYILKKRFFYDTTCRISSTYNGQKFNFILQRTATHIDINTNVKKLFVKLELKEYDYHENLAKTSFKYKFPASHSLPSGKYSLEIEKKGFISIYDEIEIDFQGAVKDYTMLPVQFHTKKAALFRSLIWPGAGQRYLKREGSEYLMGFVGWSVMGAGIYSYYDASNIYDEYLASNITTDRANLKSDYMKSHQNAELFFISAGVIWGLNMVLTALMPSEKKRYNKMGLIGNYNKYSNTMQVGLVVTR